MINIACLECACPFDRDESFTVPQSVTSLTLIGLPLDQSLIPPLLNAHHLSTLHLCERTSFHGRGEEHDAMEVLRQCVVHPTLTALELESIVREKWLSYASPARAPPPTENEQSDSETAWLMRRCARPAVAESQTQQHPCKNCRNSTKSEHKRIRKEICALVSPNTNLLQLKVTPDWDPNLEWTEHIQCALTLLREDLFASFSQLTSRNRRLLHNWQCISLLLASYRANVHSPIRDSIITLAHEVIVFLVPHDMEVVHTA